MSDTFHIDKDAMSVKVAGETQFYLFNHKKQKAKKRNSLSRLGIWVDHSFSFLSDVEWKSATTDFDSSHMVTTSYQHPFLSLSLTMKEAIDPHESFYIRKIEMKNNFNIRRKVKLFFYQNISPTHHSAGDTAFFAPREKVFYHFRKNSCWLFNGMINSNGIKQYTSFSQMTSKPLERHCFNKEDGNLFINPIAKGYVTSVFSLETELLPFEVANFYYWLASDKEKQEVYNKNRTVIMNGPEHIFNQVISTKKMVNA